MSRNIGTRSEKRSGETRTNSPADNYPHIFTNRKVLSILADVMRKYAPVRITIFHAHTRFFGQFTHDTISPILDDMSDTMKQKKHKETSYLKFSYICNVGFYRQTYRKCFRTVLNGKCGSFQSSRTTDSTHFLFRSWTGRILRARYSISIQVWGIASSFIVTWVIPQPSVR